MITSRSAIGSQICRKFPRRQNAHTGPGWRTPGHRPPRSPRSARRSTSSLDQPQHHDRRRGSPSLVEDRGVVLRTAPARPNSFVRTVNRSAMSCSCMTPEEEHGTGGHARTVGRKSTDMIKPAEDPATTETFEQCNLPFLAWYGRPFPARTNRRGLLDEALSKRPDSHFGLAQPVSDVRGLARADAVPGHRLEVSLLRMRGLFPVGSVEAGIRCACPDVTPTRKSSNVSLPPSAAS
jgi:hypothetical protein